MTPTTRVVIYTDERTDLGKEALQLLARSPHPVVTIPTEKCLPFAVWGRRRYTGLEEIKLLAEELCGASSVA